MTNRKTPRKHLVSTMLRQSDLLDQQGDDIAASVMREGALALQALDAERERREKVLELAIRYGGIDGEHHKTWVIDQVVRALAADEYEKLIADAKAGDDGPDTYEWDEGIAP